jgi:hypothetical protein
MTREEFITEYSRINRKLEDYYYPRIRKAIHSKTAEVSDRLKDSIHEARAFLAKDISNPQLTKIIRELYVEVGSRHARLNYSRLKSLVTLKGFGYNEQWIAFITDFLNKFLLDKVTIQINETTRDALLAALDDMQQRGLSTDQMIDELENWPFEKYQAARIARTEVNRAANTGAKAQNATSEWQQVKEWIAVEDFRTRGRHAKDHADHWDLNGTVVDEDAFFIDPRNGDHLDFPGDPRAKAESTINCRCAVSYSYKRDKDGNLIPKRRSTVIVHPMRPREVITI